MIKGQQRRDIRVFATVIEWRLGVDKPDCMIEGLNIVELFLDMKHWKRRGEEFETWVTWHGVKIDRLSERQTVWGVSI